MASQKDEKMASKTTISNEDLISLTAKFLRGDGGAQKLSRSHLGLYASDNEVCKLKCKIEHRAKQLRDSKNADIVANFLDEKEAKEELEEPLHSEKELSRRAFDLVMNQGYSSRVASDFMKDNFNFEISHSTIANRVREAKSLDNSVIACMTPKMKPGPKSRYPDELMDKVFDWVVEMRMRKLHVSKDLIRTQLFQTLPERCHHWYPDGMVSDFVYRSFMKKFEKQLNSPSDGKAHDVQRECQETEKSISDYFKVVAETAVKSGLAVWNENYDSNVPFSEAIHWTKPERVISFDETDLPLGNGAKDVPRRTTPGTVTLKDDKLDQKQILCQNSSFKASGVGGSYGNGVAVPAKIIWRGQSLKPENLIGGPVVVINGKEVGCTHFCNDTGSMKEHETTDYILNNILCNMNPPPSEENMVMIICDCYGDHLNADVLNMCKKNHTELLGRPPKTTHLTQNEDILNFGVFKPKFAAFKNQSLLCKLLLDLRASHKAKDLLSLMTHYFLISYCLHVYNDTIISFLQ